MENRTDAARLSPRRNASLKTANTDQQSATMERPREIPASTPEFKSFAHIRNPKQRRAKEYEQKLLLLKDLYPEYAEGLDEQIAWARAQQERKPASDRDRVLKQLEACELSCREVADDLQIPYATAYKILNEFATAGIVIIRERAGRFGQKPVCYYSIAH